MLCWWTLSDMAVMLRPNIVRTLQRVEAIISYLGMKSWDLHVCDRASTITHVDRVKKSNP